MKWQHVQVSQDILPPSVSVTKIQDEANLLFNQKRDILWDI